jgi:alpha-galactosidase
MNKPPKIVIIGAGSAVFGLKALASIIRSKRLRGTELQLVDIDEPALNTMTRLAELMNDSWDAGMTINGTTDRRQALPQADLVVVSVQVGPREEMWEQDWKIPLKHGIRQPYAENSGPGAFAHTARNLPLLIDIARDMEELCPEAWYLNFTNPLIRLTWAVQRYTRVKVVGLCHQLKWAHAMAMAIVADRYDFPIPEKFNVHTNYTNKPFLAPVMAAGEKHLDIKAAGINHFSWVYDIRDRATGDDLYPLIRERWLKEYRRDFEPLSRELFEIFGMMPTPGDAHLCEFIQWAHDPVTRPWEKYNIELQSWQGNLRRRADRRAIAEETVAGKRPVDDLLTQSSEGIVEIAEAMTYNDNYYHHQLNLQNNGCLPNLPDEAIVEVPGSVSGLGIRGLNMPPLPEPIAEMCRRELAYSSLVVDASYHGDRELALQALLLDPMVNDIDRARSVLADFWVEFEEYLPQFHGRWNGGG